MGGDYILSMAAFELQGQNCVVVRETVLSTGIGVGPVESHSLILQTQKQLNVLSRSINSEQTVYTSSSE